MKTKTSSSGLPYGYLTAAAKRLGVSVEAIRRRAASGWPLHELHRRERPAGETSWMHVRQNVVEWGLDRPRDTLKAKALAVGMNPATLYQRLKAGLPLQRALAAPLQRGPQAGSLHSKAREAGLPYSRLAQRLRSGWPMERALAEPVDPARSKGQKARWKARR